MTEQRMQFFKGYKNFSEKVLAILEKALYNGTPQVI